MRGFIIFLLISIMLITLGGALDENWYKNQEITTGSFDGESLFERQVGNNVVAAINGQPDDSDFDVLKYENGWILVQYCQGEQHWVQVSSIGEFYSTGKAKYSDENTQQSGMEFGLIGLLAIVLVYWKRR